MTAALGTLPFLATLWLLIVAGARVVEESGPKIAAALKGTPPRLPSGVRLRCPARSSARSTRVTDAEWRAAA
jgi:hypothetical protein